MSRTDDLSDEERFALEAIEAVLSDEAGASNHAELGALSRLLARTTPRPDPVFEADLEEHLIGLRRRRLNDIEMRLEPAGTPSGSDHQSQTPAAPPGPAWTMPAWIGRGIRQTVDVAVTLGLVAIFFFTFLWPALRPGRDRYDFYIRMPEGLTHTDLFGTAAPPHAVVVDGHETWRSLTVAEVQSLVNYAVLHPPDLPGLRFQGASYSHADGRVITRYLHREAQQTFVLEQQPVSDALEEGQKLPIGPQSRVETVQVRGARGEYVEGTWNADLDHSYFTYINRYENPLDLDWDAILRLQWVEENHYRTLRWEQAGILYTIQVSDLSTSTDGSLNAKSGTLVLDRDGILQLAEALQ